MNRDGIKEILNHYIEPEMKLGVKTYVVVNKILNALELAQKLQNRGYITKRLTLTAFGREKGIRLNDILKDKKRSRPSDSTDQLTGFYG